jgi:hypothetical protein
MLSSLQASATLVSPVVAFINTSSSRRNATSSPRLVNHGACRLLERDKGSAVTLASALLGR